MQNWMLILSLLEKMQKITHKKLWVDTFAHNKNFFLQILRSNEYETAQTNEKHNL